MTTEVDAAPAMETWRKRLRYRAWHRGIREMDLILGRFADSWLVRFGAVELAQFEEILEIADPTLHDWLRGLATPPQSARNRVLDLLLEFWIDASDSGTGSSNGQM